MTVGRECGCMIINRKHGTVRRICIKSGKDEVDCVLLPVVPELVINDVLQDGPAWKLICSRNGVGGLDERKL